MIRLEDAPSCLNGAVAIPKANAPTPPKNVWRSESMRYTKHAIFTHTTRRSSPAIGTKEDELPLLPDEVPAVCCWAINVCSAEKRCSTCMCDGATECVCGIIQYRFVHRARIDNIQNRALDFVLWLSFSTRRILY